MSFKSLNNSSQLVLCHNVKLLNHRCTTFVVSLSPPSPAHFHVACVIRVLFVCYALLCFMLTNYFKTYPMFIPLCGRICLCCVVFCCLVFLFLFLSHLNTTMAYTGQPFVTATTNSVFSYHLLIICFIRDEVQ